MQFRELGRTGWKVSTISFGAWAIGAEWGSVSDRESLAALHHALDKGVNFFDTADVYGDGRSERLLGQLRRQRPDPFYIATKAGRRLNPHAAEGYNRSNLTAFVERSLLNLDTDCLDLLQLHCPPTAVYYMPEVFGFRCSSSSTSSGSGPATCSSPKPSAARSAFSPGCLYRRGS